MLGFDTEEPYRGNRCVYPVLEHLLIEPYCILCRDTLLFGKRFVSDPSDVPGGIESWKVEVFCFFSIPGFQDAPSRCRAHIFRARLTESKWYDGEAPTQKILRRAETRLCDQTCSLCDPNVTANLIHQSCFQMLKNKLRMDQVEITADFLCKTAMMLRPVMNWASAVRMMDTQIRPSQFWLPDPSSETGLAHLVSRLQRRMPVELQRHILVDLPSYSFFSSLQKCLAAMQTTNLSRITETTLPSKNPEVNYHFPTIQSHPEHLYVSAVNILGEECFTAIGSYTKSGSSLSVKRLPLQGLQYALGSYGVIALRLLYEDGSFSSWLGRSHREWVATVRGDDITNLTATTDGFKPISLEFGKDKPDSTRAFRDTEIPPSKDSQSFLIDTRISRVGIRGNPRQRFVPHLFLDLENNSTNSLTMFCDPDSVCGIQLNDQTHHMLGNTKRNCCAITYYLQPGEFIKSLHLITRGDVQPFLFQGPYLVAITSAGRTLFYAPEALLRVPERHFSNFTNNYSHCVSGIFHDPGTARKVGERSLGVMLQPQRDHPGSDILRCLGTFPLAFPDITPSFFKIFAGIAFLSKANLARVRSLKMQKVDNRCLGLLIQRTDDSIDILGQWNPSLRNESSTLYDHKMNFPLQSVTCIYSHMQMVNGRAFPARKFIQDIVINKSDTETRSFKWEHLDKDIAWWFTFEYDFIEYWTSTETNIEMTESNIPPVLVE